jgi:hypothetical protein
MDQNKGILLDEIISQIFAIGPNQLSPLQHDAHIRGERYRKLVSPEGFSRYKMIWNQGPNNIIYNDLQEPLQLKF